MSQNYRDGIFWVYPDPIWVSDPATGRLLDVNQAALDSLGYEFHAFLALNLADLCPHAQNPALATLLQTPGSHELSLRSGSGEIASWSVSLRRLDADASAPVLFSIDLKAMQEQDRVLRQLTDHMPGIIYILEELPDGSVRMPYVSVAIRKVFGIEASTMADKPRLLYELIYPQDLAKVKAAHDRALQAKSGWKLEYRIRHGITGETRWIYGEAVPQFRANGSVIWYGYVADVSEVGQVRESLRLNDERLRLAKEIAGIGVWELNLASDEMIWDARMFEIYGQPPAPVVSFEAWKAMIHPDEQHKVEALSSDLLGPAPYSFRHRIVRPDGEIRHIEIFGRLFYDQQGLAIKSVGVNVDITSLVQGEEDLRQSKIELESSNLQLRERVKELTLLHRLASMLQTGPSFSPQIFQAMVPLIPPGMFYPSICEARISWGDYAASTPHFKTTPWKLMAGFEAGGISGCLEVVYLIQMPAQDCGPFLTEERALVETIAEMLKIYLEQQTALKAIQAREAMLRQQNQRLLDIAWKQSHDVRRPLANILGLLDLMQANEPLPETLSHLEQEARALDGIVRDLVSTSEEALISLDGKLDV